LLKDLGYEPPLNVSILSELNLRNALKRHSLGEITKADLQDYIDFQTRFIMKVLLEEIPSFQC